MALGVPALVGSDAQKGGSNPVISVTVSTGDLLVVAIEFFTANFVDGDVTWNGIAMANDSLIVGTNSQLLVYSLKIASGGTANVTLTFDGATDYSILCYKISGAAASPLDKEASATGTSTSPSSGNTATTAQANEALFGFVGTNGPSGDTAGSWSGSFAALDRVGTTGGAANTNMTLSAAYRIVSATGAYSAAKTGITSREWEASIVTYKEQGGTTIATGMSEETDTALAPSGVTKIRAVGRSDETDEALALGAKKIRAVGMAEEVDAALAPGVALRQYPVGMATETDSVPDVAGGGPYPYIYRGTEANGIIDADATPITDGASSIVESRGVRSYGQPYFAMATGPLPAAGLDTLHLGGRTLFIVMALHSAPVQIADPDEVHLVASIHEMSGAEIMAIGVTPSLRIVGVCARGNLASAPGLVPVDGVARRYGYGRGRVDLDPLVPGVNSSIVGDDDGILAFSYDGGDFGTEDLTAPVGGSTRVMLFNGVAARTRLDCTIFGFQIETRPHNFVWPMAPLTGTTTPGYDCIDGLGQPIVLNDPLAYGGLDLTLTAQFYDPRPAYPLAVGDFPATNVNAAYGRALNTQYRRREIVTPDYRLVGQP